MAFGKSRMVPLEQVKHIILRHHRASQQEARFFLGRCTEVHMLLQGSAERRRGGIVSLGG